MRELPAWMAALIIALVVLFVAGLFLWHARRQPATPQVPTEVLEKFRGGERPRIPGMGPAAVPRPAPPKGQ